MKGRILVIITIWFMCHPSFAQYQNVRVGESINTYEPEEASIVINPANPDHILVGSNIDNYYYSVDGGLN
jgi:hypothetical protein